MRIQYLGKGDKVERGLIEDRPNNGLTLVRSTPDLRGLSRLPTRDQPGPLHLDHQHGIPSRLNVERCCSSPFTVVSLDPSQTYACTVKATNANRDSALSAASNPITPNSTTAVPCAGWADTEASRSSASVMTGALPPSSRASATHSPSNRRVACHALATVLAVAVTWMPLRMLPLWCVRR